MIKQNAMNLKSFGLLSPFINNKFMNQMHSYRHYYSVGTKRNNRGWRKKETKATEDEQKGIQTIKKTFQFNPIPLRSRNIFNKATVKNIYYLVYCFKKKDIQS